MSDTNSDVGSPRRNNRLSRLRGGSRRCVSPCDSAERVRRHCSLTHSLHRSRDSSLREQERKITSVKKTNPGNADASCLPSYQPDPSATNLKKIKYKKRTGTSGINGQLYEIKLLTLYLYRTCKDIDIVSFYLGTNLDGIGAFDDIFLKFKLKNKWIGVFLQAKHKDEPKKGGITDGDLISVKSDFNLEKYVESFLKIKERMTQVPSDGIFTGDMDCYFIIFTPATAKVKNKVPIQPNIQMNKIINLLSTSNYKNCRAQGDIFQIKPDNSLILKLGQSLNKITGGTSELNDGNTPPTDSNLIKQFLDSLFFFTKECTQDRVEEVMKEELSECELGFNKQKITKEDIDIFYFKIMEKVQEWWNKSRKAEYLTKECSYIMASRTEMYLNTLNDISTNDCTKYDLKFSSEAVTKLLSYLPIALSQLPDDEVNSKVVTTIFSNSVLLTCAKLVQALSALKLNVIDINNKNSLHLDEFLKNAIKMLKSDVLIIKYDTKQFDYSTGKCNLERICIEIIELFPKHVIVVTGQMLSQKIFSNIIFDKNSGLIDLIRESQNDVLASKKVIVQGEEVSLKSIISDKSKYLIDGEILLRLIKNENIIVGTDLKIDKKYSDLHYYVPRYLINENNKKYDVNNFKDLSDRVVVITAEPGMGKSTMVSHLSIETKKKLPKIWIVRINLLDHCSVFRKWQKERSVISLQEAITLVCNAEVEHLKGRFNIQVRRDDSVVMINYNHSSAQSISKLHLELIISSYNNGNIIFIFDGFDEICPDYMEEVVKFTKHFVQSRNVWLTSRPYNNILSALVEEFATPYKLKPLSANDQKKYYLKYFEKKIQFCIGNTLQSKNIERFLDYLNKYLETNYDTATYEYRTSVMHMLLYLSAADYFLRNTPIHSYQKTANELLKTMKLFEHNNMINNQNELENHEKNETNIKQINNSNSGNPLFMFFAVKIFVKKIESRGSKDSDDKWSTNDNSLRDIQSYIEMTFEIRWKEKIGRDINKPGEYARYEKDKKEFIDNNKKLAFFTLFHNSKHFQHVVSSSDWLEIKETIRKLKNGEENSGLIQGTHNNIPRYTHLVFAEYLAAEHIADGIKSDDIDIRMNTINLICVHALNSTHVEVLSFFEKLLFANEELGRVLSESESLRHIYEVLYGHSIWQFYLQSSSVSIRDVQLYYPKLHVYIINSIANNLNKNFFINLQNLIMKFGRNESTNKERLFKVVLDMLREINPTTMRNAVNGLPVERCLFTRDSNKMLSNQEIFKLMGNLEFKPLNDFEQYDEHWNIYITSATFFKSQIEAALHKKKCTEYEILQRIRQEISESNELKLQSQCKHQDTFDRTDIKRLNLGTDTDKNCALSEIITYMKTFTENIFKDICKENDVNYSDKIADYQKDKKLPFENLIKKIAFFVLFGKRFWFSEIVIKSECSEIKEAINKIKEGKDFYSGLKDRILDKNARFIHSFVTQYFACEYIADRMNSLDSAVKEKVIKFFLYIVIQENGYGLRDIFEKLLVHKCELRKALSDNESKKIIYKTLFGNNYLIMHWYISQLLRNEFSKEITRILLNSINGNLDRYFFRCLQYHYLDYEEPNTNVIEHILDMIRKMRPVDVKYELGELDVEYCFFNKKSLDMLSNQEILKRLRQYRDKWAQKSDSDSD